MGLPLHLLPLALVASYERSKSLGNNVGVMDCGISRHTYYTEHDNYSNCQAIDLTITIKVEQV